MATPNNIRQTIKTLAESPEWAAALALRSDVLKDVLVRAAAAGLVTAQDGEWAATASFARAQKMIDDVVAAASAAGMI